MAQVGTLTVDLIAQTASFNANIAKAASNLNSNAARMNRAMAGVQSGIDKAATAARVASFALAGGALVEMARRSLDYASSLGEVSQQLGVTTRDLQVFRYIGSQVGVAQEDMDAGLRKLTVSLGNASVGAAGPNKAFAALGISIRDSTGHVKTAGQVLPEIAQKLAGIPDPAQRAAAEVALFGKTGQQLDTILTGGAKGIQEYADRAEQLGLVLDDKLIGQADEAADRVAELTQQLKVNFASTVAQNAGSILTLANALAALTTSSLQFIANYPRLVSALTGAAVGLRMGGPIGAAIGGGAGVIGGQALATRGVDENMDLKFRLKKLNDARRLQQGYMDGTGGKVSLGGLFEVKRGDPRGMGSLSAATANVRRETDLTRKAIAAAQSKNMSAVLPPVVDLPEFKGGGSGGGRGSGRADNSAEKAAEQAKRNAEDFANDLARLNSDLLSAKRSNVTEAWQIADIARQELEADTSQLRASIASDVAAGKYTQAQADQLLAVNDQVAAQKKLTINTEQAERIAADALKVNAAANDNERDMLQVAERLSVTQDERRTIALRLLDLDKQEEKLRLESIAASAQTTQAEKDIAKARLAQLDALYAGRAASTKRDTAGPGAAYLDQLNMTSGQINEAIQGIEVRGLQSLNEELTQAIMGAKSLGEAFKAVASQIIADLLRIAIQQAIVKPLANALFGGTGIGIPGFATGTSSAPSGWALVGERGPEIVKFRGGEQVIPNHQLGGMRGGGQQVHSPTFVFPGITNARDAREAAGQAARRYRQEINGPIRWAS